MVAKPENHLQTRVTLNEPAFDGRIRKPLSEVTPIPLDERKIIGRRAAMELRTGAIVNMGIGMPDTVSNTAADENVADLMSLTIELGAFGGIPAQGMDFPAAINADCIVDHPSMFDFYDGGGLDICFLGAAQIDEEGNTNVSKFGPKVVGPGGYVNISSSAKKVVYCDVTASGAEYEVSDGKLKILKEGKIKKFVKECEHVTFSGKYSAERGQEVIYVTERAVFVLKDGKVVLTEIAPGVDLEKDVLSQIEFEPVISPDLKEMPKEIFQPKWGKLREMLVKNGD